jgi:hypothetical protein
MRNKTRLLAWVIDLDSKRNRFCVGSLGESPGQEWTVLGDTPNLAARLQTIAAPGTVVVAPTTHRLVREAFACHTLGAQEIKGIASPLQVWQVLGPSHVTNRSWARLTAHTPMVGRGAPFTTLEASEDRPRSCRIAQR